MPDNAHIWRFMLLVAGGALARAAVLGIALSTGCLWLTLAAVLGIALYAGYLWLTLP